MAFSPRPWGWSAHGHGTAVQPSTHVFSPRPWGWSAVSDANPGGIGNWFSPRPWGWSYSGPSLLNGFADWCSPHARGDGPGNLPSAVIFRPRFSPRPWGWSETPRAVAGRSVRRSPHARGDGPELLAPFPVGPCFPHARGDGPRMRTPVATWMSFSPRPWGWSGETSLLNKD